MPSARTKTSTQRFTEIADIKDNVVLLTNNHACIVIEVSSVNFSLLSGDEQNAKVYAYASLLNSLSFPIEIIIRSKAVEVKPYLDRLDEALQQTTNSQLGESIKQYKDFIQNLVSLTTVLDKQFYIVISYSTLEGGATKAAQTISANKNDLMQQAQTALNTKAETIIPQIERLALKTHVLEGETLIRFFHDIYNPEVISETTTEAGAKTP